MKLAYLSIWFTLQLLSGQFFNCEKIKDMLDFDDDNILTNAILLAQWHSYFDLTFYIINNYNLSINSINLTSEVIDYTFEAGHSNPHRKRTYLNELYPKSF